MSLVTPHTYVYDTAGEKRRTIQFNAAGVMTPSNFYFTGDGRVLVAAGLLHLRETVKGCGGCGVRAGVRGVGRVRKGAR